MKGRLWKYATNLHNNSSMETLHESCNCWANIPPELLRDIVQRVEASENTWPSRKHVVACAGVCRSWREVTKELVQSPQEAGKLTFPLSLKQPGPRDHTISCFIKRDRATSTYFLYLGFSPILTEKGKFLLAARKFRRATGTDFIISLDANDMSRGANSYFGKLRSNFLGTKFTVYDVQPPDDGVQASTNRATQSIASKQLPSKHPTGSCNVGHISYELNVLGTRGPRLMQCTLHSIPASAVECCDSNTIELLNSVDKLAPQFSSWKPKGTVADCKTIAHPEFGGTKDAPLVLKNKVPRWHEQLQCWCLNFRGRVTVASVKNFQLVTAMDPSESASQNDQDRVLLQFGKVGKDMFTMDYRYPLSAFQGFAICLSSFDSKLACEC